MENNNILKNWRKNNIELTEENINKIIELNFNDFLPMTKIYIKNSIKTLGRKFYIKRTSMVKEDFINEFNKSRKDSSFVPEYDFSLLPDLIDSKSAKVKVLCKNTICGIEIGEFETTFNSLIINKTDVFSSIEKFTKESKNHNKEWTDQLKNRIINYCGKERFNLDLVRYSSATIPVKLRCNNCGRYFWRTPNDILSQIKSNNDICSLCNKDKVNRDKIQSFTTYKNNCERLHGDRFNYDKSEKDFNGLQSYITIHCNVCNNDFITRAGMHLYSHGETGCCPNCSQLSRYKLRVEQEDFIEKAQDILGENYDLSKAKYSGWNSPVLIIDKNTGEEFYQTPKRIYEGRVRTDLGISSQENEVFNWLKRHNINFIPHKNIENIVLGRTKMLINVDFIIENFNGKTIWGECNGPQHYFFSGFCKIDKGDSKTAEERYISQIKRDANERKYCEDPTNNIILLEIPFNYMSPKEIDNILTRVLIEFNDPKDVITLPPIQQI